MRSVGGARLIGLAACCLACAAYRPTLREPPPPKMEPMPPPEPAAARAPTAEAEAAEPGYLVEWDAGARTIRCGENVVLSIPAGLTVYERAGEGGELTVTPPGSPPTAALIVVDVGATGVSIVGTQAGPCVFVAVELVRPDAAQRFAPMLQRMCASKKTKCASNSTLSSKLKRD